MKSSTSFLVILIFSFFLIPLLAEGQIIPSKGGEKKLNDKNFSFLPIPYINYDRTLGLSGGLLPIAMYNLSKKDTISPSSMSGAFGMYTTNDSWFLLQFNKLYFKEDRYRALMAIGKGNINFQFFAPVPGIEDFLDYGTTASFFKVELQRRIFPNLYFGLNFIQAELDTEIIIPDMENVTETTTLKGLGAVISYDIRDNVYYPAKGFFTNLNYNSYPEFLDNAYVSNKITLDYNHFFEMKNKRDIIGTRLYAGVGIGDLNFNQQFIIGNNDIRGYTQGKYRGDQIIALQGEYRFNPYKKLGFVGFAGVASVFSTLNESDNGKVLPAIGTGFRYNVFPKNHLNVGMDFAAGIGDWGIYFKIGEAF